MSQQRNNVGTHWRDSALTPKFFFVDARAAFGVLLVLLRPHLWTLCVAVGLLLFLGTLNHFKIPLVVMARICRGAILGPKRTLEYR